MKKFLPLAMVIVGGLMLDPGLLFLCAAVQEPKRLLLSLLLLAGGGGAGFLWWTAIGARARAQPGAARRAHYRTGAHLGCRDNCSAGGG